MIKLMIADDEQQIINGLKKMINWQDYGIGVIETATDYVKAKELAIRSDPDIAIIDVRIGQDYGYDLMNELNNFNLHTKYITISGYDDFEFVRKSLLAGAKDYILKPISKIKLEDIIKNIVVNDLHGNITNNSANTAGNIDPVLVIPYSKLSKLTNKIITIIKNEYMNNVNLKYVADLFLMNSTYLGQVFLKETGLKFSDYLLSYRMYMAKHMIEYTEHKISYIAYKTGYNHINHFYLHFKAFYGISPTSLRSDRSENEKETFDKNEETLYQ